MVEVNQRRSSYLVNLQLIGGCAVNEECFRIRTPFDFGRVVERNVTADGLVLLATEVLGEPGLCLIKRSNNKRNKNYKI